MSIRNSSSHSALYPIPNAEEIITNNDKRFMKFQNAIIPGKNITGLPTSFLSKGMYNLYFNNNKKLKETINSNEEKIKSFDLANYEKKYKLRDSVNSIEKSIENLSAKKQEFSGKYYTNLSKGHKNFAKNTTNNLSNNNNYYFNNDFGIKNNFTNNNNNKENHSILKSNQNKDSLDKESKNSSMEKTKEHLVKTNSIDSARISSHNKTKSHFNFIDNGSKILENTTQNKVKIVNEPLIIKNKNVLGSTFTNLSLFKSSKKMGHEIPKVSLTKKKYNNLDLISEQFAAVDKKAEFEFDTFNMDIREGSVVETHFNPNSKSNNDNETLKNLSNLESFALQPNLILKIKKIRKRTIDSTLELNNITHNEKTNEKTLEATLSNKENLNKTSEEGMKENTLEEEQTEEKAFKKNEEENIDKYKKDFINITYDFNGNHNNITEENKRNKNQNFSYLNQTNYKSNFKRIISLDINSKYAIKDHDQEKLFSDKKNNNNTRNNTDGRSNHNDTYNININKTTMEDKTINENKTPNNNNINNNNNSNNHFNQNSTYHTFNKLSRENDSFSNINNINTQLKNYINTSNNVYYENTPMKQINLNLKYKNSNLRYAFTDTKFTDPECTIKDNPQEDPITNGNFNILNSKTNSMLNVSTILKKDILIQDLLNRKFHKTNSINILTDNNRKIIAQNNVIYEKPIQVNKKDGFKNVLNEVYLNIPDQNKSRDSGLFGPEKLSKSITEFKNAAYSRNNREKQNDLSIYNKNITSINRELDSVLLERSGTFQISKSMEKHFDLNYFDSYENNLDYDYNTNLNFNNISNNNSQNNYNINHNQNKIGNFNPNPNAIYDNNNLVNLSNNSNSNLTKSIKNNQSLSNTAFTNSKYKANFSTKDYHISIIEEKEASKFLENEEDEFDPKKTEGEKANNKSVISNRDLCSRGTLTNTDVNEIRSNSFNKLIKNSPKKNFSNTGKEKSPSKNSKSNLINESAGGEINGNSPVSIKVPNHMKEYIEKNANYFYSNEDYNPNKSSPSFHNTNSNGNNHNHSNINLAFKLDIERESGLEQSNSLIKKFSKHSSNNDINMNINNMSFNNNSNKNSNTDNMNKSNPVLSKNSNMNRNELAISKTSLSFKSSGNMVVSAYGFHSGRNNGNSFGKQSFRKTLMQGEFGPQNNELMNYSSNNINRILDEFILNKKESFNSSKINFCQNSIMKQKSSGNNTPMSVSSIDSSNNVLFPVIKQKINTLDRILTKNYRHQSIYDRLSRGGNETKDQNFINNFNNAFIKKSLADNKSKGSVTGDNFSSNKKTVYTNIK